jgi:signal transduction histidine kinase/DNA-binding response OmpR family regulator
MSNGLLPRCRAKNGHFFVSDTTTLTSYKKIRITFVQAFADSRNRSGVLTEIFSDATTTTHAFFTLAVSPLVFQRSYQHYPALEYLMPNSTFRLSIIFPVLLFACMVLGSCVLFAQSDANIDVVLYDTDTGLPNNHVFQSFEDSRGSIWLIDERGLVFFDGVSFNTILNLPSTSQSCSTRICFEDMQGNLWIRIQGLFEVQYTLINIYTNAVKEGLPQPFDGLKGPVFDLALGPDQSLLICDEAGGLWQINSKGEPKLIYTCDSKKFLFCNSVNNDKYIWISPQDPVGMAPVFTAVDYTGLSCRFVSPDITHISVPARDGAIWSIGHSSFARLEPFKTAEYKRIDTVVKGYIPDESWKENGIGIDAEKEIIWMINRGGLMLWHPSKGLICHFLQYQGLVKPKVAFQILMDKNHQAWVSTIGGLFKVSVSPSKFRKIIWKDPKVLSNIPERPCRGIIEHSNGKFYINAGADLFFYDKATNKAQVILNDRAGNYALAEDQDGTLLLALSGLFRYDLKTHENRPIYTPKFSETGIIWSILPRRDRVWLGNNLKILYYDKISGEIRQDIQYNGFDVLQHADVYQFYEKAGGKSMLLVTNFGLFEVNYEEGVVAWYRKNGKGRFFLPCDDLRSLCEDGMGGFWIASTNGLIHWNPDFWSTRWYSSRDALLNDNLYAVYRDDYGFLWFSCNGGIGQFQVETEKVRYYTTRDGITHQEFNRISHCKAADGTIFFGSLNGVTMFHPRDFCQEFEVASNASVFLTKAVLFSSTTQKEEQMLSSFYQDGLITINPNDRYLKLDFAMSDYSESKKIEYSYTIEGLFDNWLSSKSPEIQLAGLPFGKYTLVVRARSTNGFLPRECRIQIDAPAPIYLRGWFLAISMLFLVAVLTALYQYRVRRFRMQQLELERAVVNRTRHISQAKRLIEQQSEQISKMAEEKSRFFANVTHELRTPIALILGVVNNIQTGKYSERQHKELLSVANRNTQYLLKMVNQILYFSKAEKLNNQMAIVRLMADDIVGPLVEDYKIIAQNKGIKITYISNKSNIDHLQVDKDYLGIVIGNLLSNAVKFTDTNGRITVCIENKAQKVVVSVKDTGKGIHPLDLPHIFERYYQTQLPGAPTEGGSGIGLALAKELTELMNGQIWVERGASGSVFYVEFPSAPPLGSPVQPIPVAPDQHHQVPQLPEARNTAKHFLKQRILLVEDHPDFQYMLKMTLQQSYDVFGVFNGAEAISYMAQNPLPDLILCDIMMPTMDGLQFVAQLKAVEIFAQIPIVFLTARSGPEIKLDAMRLGVDDYLTKPIQSEVLLQVVQTLLFRKRTRERYASEIGQLGRPEVPSHLSKADIAWVVGMEKAVYAGLSDVNFSVDKLAQTMMINRTTFYQQIKLLTGMTPNQYVQEARLQQARFYLEGGQFETVKAVVDAVGMRDQKYFSQQYTRRFGKSIATYFPNP